MTSFGPKYRKLQHPGPEQCRDQDRREDQQPAHGRGAGLGQDVALRPVGADRLAPSLAHPQELDQRPTEQEAVDERG